MLKPDVREIAARAGLVTAAKKDSQGICFVGKVKLPEFLKQKLAPRDGDIVEIPASHPMYAQYEAEVSSASSAEERLRVSSRAYSYKPSDGIVAGRHHGAHFFTVGQRKGLDVGGRPRTSFHNSNRYGYQYRICGPGKIASGVVPPCVVRAGFRYALGARGRMSGRRRDA